MKDYFFYVNLFKLCDILICWMKAMLFIYNLHIKYKVMKYCDTCTNIKLSSHILHVYYIYIRKTLLFGYLCLMKYRNYKNQFGVVDKKLV